MVFRGLGTGFTIFMFACSGSPRSFGDGDGVGGADGEAGQAGDLGGTDSGGQDAKGPGGAGAGGSGDVAVQPVSIVSVSPGDGDTAKPRDAIAIEFSQAVPADKVEEWLSLTNTRGAVPGRVSVSGTIATFKPDLSLCYDEAYELVLTPDAEGVLGSAHTSTFTIPDGSWQKAVSIGDEVAGSDYPTIAIDENGNALAAWLYGDVTPTVNYFDAQAGEWNGPEPISLDPVASNLVSLRAAFDDAGTAYALWSEYGLATLQAGQWQTVPLTDLVGSTTYFGAASLAASAAGGAVLLWDIQSGYTPGQIYAATQAPGGAWVEPEAATATAWSTRPYVAALPDGSFMAVYYNTTDAGTLGNIVSRRYTAADGWSEVDPLGPGTTHAVSSNRATGDIIVGWPNYNGGESAFVTVYRHATGIWGAPIELELDHSTGFVMPAIAADGTAFVILSDSDTENDVYRIVARRLVDGEWGDPVTLREDSTFVLPSSVAADNCGNALVVWKQGYDLYSRRFTPADGWKDPALVGQDESGHYNDIMSMNGRGEAIVISGRGNGEFPPEDTAAARFE